MFYEKPTSFTSSSHNTCRRRSFNSVVGGRIRTLLLIIFATVLAALLTDILMSSELVSILDEEDQTEEKVLHVTGNKESNNSSIENTFAPTPKPTTPNPTTLQPTGPPKKLPSSSSSWQDTGDSASDSVVLPPPPPLIENASLIFVSRWCDVDMDSWFPTKTKAWQQRAPYVLIPGAKHAGGEELAHLLEQHPQMVLSQSSSLGQFYPQRFHAVNRDDQTHVLIARAKMYARDYASIKSNEQLLGIDYTSGYLFYSPTRILCVMPWVRLLIVLRDPVDRIWFHYQAAMKVHGFRGSFDEWMERDWKVLENSGLTSIRPSNTTALDLAWHEYHSKTAEGSIGRSLYEPQMRQWFQAMRAVGRNINTDVLVVYVEHLMAEPERVLNRVTDFLGLKTKGLSYDTNAIMQQLKIDSKSVGITDSKRKELESFFEPYNKRLKQILKSYKVPTTRGK